MEDKPIIDVMVADASHEVYVDTILETITAAAKVRGTGIAKRTHEYVAQKSACPAIPRMWISRLSTPVCAPVKSSMRNC